MNARTPIPLRPDYSAVHRVNVSSLNRAAAVAAISAVTHEPRRAHRVVALAG